MCNFSDESIMEKNVSRERVFNGIILNIDHVTNILPNGKKAKREIAVHVGASAALPIEEDGSVYLVRQFRAPLDAVLLEIPAGKLEHAGEDRLLAAKRELAEETGLEAENWLHLTDVFTTAGFSNERISLYLARKLHKGQSHPDDDEFLNLVKLPFDEALAMVMHGEIRDAKTQIALLMASKLLQCKEGEQA